MKRAVPPVKKRGRPVPKMIVPVIIVQFRLLYPGKRVDRIVLYKDKYLIVASDRKLVRDCSNPYYLAEGLCIHPCLPATNEERMEIFRAMSDVVYEKYSY